MRRIAVAFAVSCVVLFAVSVGWPKRSTGSTGQNGSPIGRYQLATFSGSPQASTAGHSSVGFYLVDTSTGELWALTKDAKGKAAWEPYAEGLR